MANATQAFSINIKAGKYGGLYSLLNRDIDRFIFQNHQGDWMGNLPYGKYGIDNSNAINGSEFLFRVESNGQITLPDKSSAAENGDTLTFKTAKINILTLKNTARRAVSANCFHTQIR